NSRQGSCATVLFALMDRQRSAGSDSLTISGIPAEMAHELAEVLAAAATACDTAMDRSDALCGFVDPSQWTRAPGVGSYRREALTDTRRTPTSIILADAGRAGICHAARRAARRAGRAPGALTAPPTVER